tara:strand:+ start:584 stop:1216 length:633 start_codon:yes stop_codon:yes gene_type:complete
MNAFNYCWYFKSAIPNRICDLLIKQGLSQNELIGKTGGFNDKKLSKEQLQTMKRKRHSDIAWLDDSWIYRELHPYVEEANKLAGWNYEWHRSESCQFTKYKLNQYYDWHNDGWNRPYDRPGTLNHGKVRKISLTCQLTDGSEYEGGELEFDFRDYDPNMRDEDKHIKKINQILPKGSIVVFPSFVWHRVKPVTKGVRYSLVMWSLGYPFK